MSIKTALTTFKNNVPKYLMKGAGLAALGVVAYDSHVLGKLQADVYSKSRDANACMDAYSNTQYLTSPSITASNLKKTVFNFEVENNLRHFVNSAVGYFKGFGTMLVDSVVPLGLGLGAAFGKGIVRKGSAIGLGVFAGVKFFKDVLGFGHYNDLNKKY